MNISLRLFSVAREAAGKSEIPISLPDGSTVRDALNYAFGFVPQLREIASKSLYAVGVDYADPLTVLKEGVQLSIIPPVQGG